jgi:flavin reductase (DIM6/NTAB) family NADH-FMN oxidoreductase RutF
MFYEPQHGHGLAHDPFRAIVAPRPIAWISTVSADGTANLAPYSFFNAFSGRPPMVGFSSEGQKHSLSNARETGEFVVNLATRKLALEMNETSRSFPSEVDEMERVGLEGLPCRLVRAQRIKGSPAALECRVLHIIDLTDLDGRSSDRFLTIGQVIGVHIDESCLVDGRFDAVAAGTIARCGYFDYSQITDMFELPRPEKVDH